MNKPIIRIVTGLAILAVGVLALFNSLNIVSIGDLFHNWWPMAVIIGGVLIFANNPREFVWPLIIIVAGTLLQLRALDVIEVNPWQLFWPLVIIAVGISTLLNRSPSGKASTNPSDSVSVILAGSNAKNTSDDYKGGKATAILGGIELDLSGATIKNEATLNLYAMLGGIEIKVPKGWQVKSAITPIAGAIEIKTAPTDKDAPTLTLVGDVVLAGVEVKH